MYVTPTFILLICSKLVQAHLFHYPTSHSTVLQGTGGFSRCEYPTKVLVQVWAATVQVQQSWYNIPLVLQILRNSSLKVHGTLYKRGCMLAPNWETINLWDEVSPVQCCYWHPEPRRSAHSSFDHSSWATHKVCGAYEGILSSVHCHFTYWGHLPFISPLLWTIHCSNTWCRGHYKASSWSVFSFRRLIYWVDLTMHVHDCWCITMDNYLFLSEGYIWLHIS